MSTEKYDTANTPDPNYVTQGDIWWMVHFLRDEDEMERWSGWEKRKDIISREFPELIAALDNLKIAEKTVNRIVGSIENEIDEYPSE